MLRTRHLARSVLAIACLLVPTAVRAADYHHVHLAAPNVAEAVQWYVTHMGCTALTTRPDGCLIGTTQLLFANRKPDAGTQGSGVDPWGTRIEVVEDPQYLGFHHIHLRSVDPDAALKWYLNVFGGQSDSLKGRLSGLRYGSVWLLVARADQGQQVAASQGRSIDHLGFAFPDLDAAAVEMKKKGIVFQTEPRAFTNAAGQNMKISFVVGPDGVRIEVVQPKA